MIEIERTFLAKRIPDGLQKCKMNEIVDLYYPKSAEHPILRMRKYGDMFLIFKKSPVDDDKSVQNEEVIELSQKEFEALTHMEAKELEKERYYYEHEGVLYHIDIFKGSLGGLVLIDVEFKTEKERNSFIMPDFCLTEVTGKDFIAGGMLCGKKYSEIEPLLNEFGYKKLYKSF